MTFKLVKRILNAYYVIIPQPNETTYMPCELYYFQIIFKKMKFNIS